jgi:hypothetical protein
LEVFALLLMLLLLLFLGAVHGERESAPERGVADVGHLLRAVC